MTAGTIGNESTKFEYQKKVDNIIDGLVKTWNDKDIPIEDWGYVPKRVFTALIRHVTPYILVEYSKGLVASKAQDSYSRDFWKWEATKKDKHIKSLEAPTLTKDDAIEIFSWFVHNKNKQRSVWYKLMKDVLTKEKNREWERTMKIHERDVAKKIFDFFCVKGIDVEVKG